MTTLQVPLTKGEIELEAIPNNPVQEFREAWTRTPDKQGALLDWLKEQYIGEREAVASMEVLLATGRKQPDANPKYLHLMEKVIADEHRHVAMIKELLISRGATIPEIGEPEVLPGMDAFFSGSAVASRAEAVRAGVIRVILEDGEVPQDVKSSFLVILREEAFHEKAFREVAGQPQMDELGVNCARWSGGGHYAIKKLSA